ncbi:MAG: hypothetical protein ACLSDM_01055 [Butyricicoccus sp.]
MAATSHDRSPDCPASAVRMSDAVILRQRPSRPLRRGHAHPAGRGAACTVGRGSVRYGDFPIAHQRDFSRLLDTPRRWLDRDRSCLLAPSSR